MKDNLKTIENAFETIETQIELMWDGKFVGTKVEGVGKALQFIRGEIERLNGEAKHE